MTESSSDPEKVDHGEGNPPSGSGIVFVCDASAEAERLMGALRNRGYSAVDVPLGLLPTRVRYETPDLILVDAEAHEAARLIAEARAASSVRVRLVLLGQPDGALSRDPSLQEAATLVFTRPLDISKAADALRELLGPPPRPNLRPSLMRSARAPMLVASARRPYRTDIAPSSRPFVKPDTFESHWPIASTPSLGPLASDALVGLGDMPPTRGVSHTSTPPSHGIASLSPETRTLLDQARRRVLSYPAQLSRPARLAVENGAHGAVSAELIAALSEPLGLTEAPQDAANTNTGDTPGGLTHRGLARATELPSASARPVFPLEESEQTNPGGRPPSRSPDDGTRVPALQAVRPPALSLPPLDDLSDLLTQPLASFRVPRMPGSEDLPPAPPSEVPSTSPGGRRVAIPTAAPLPSVIGTELPEFEPTEGWEPKLPIEALALAIRQRLSGALAQQTAGGVRRVLLRDGDLLTLTSSGEAESLVQFLAERGDLTPTTMTGLRGVPKFGRHAGAALIAQGHLSQEDLWPILRAHAEWLLGRVLATEQPLVLDRNAPQRMLEEPAVFGGAAGAEIYVDVLRRVMHSGAAFERLGSGERTLGFNAHRALLPETSLSSDVEHAVQAAIGQPLTRIKERSPTLLVVLAALTELGILTAGEGTKPVPRAEVLTEKSAEMDDAAFAALVGARRALVDDGDYFVILGIARSATRYEVDRARLELRREFDAQRLTGRNAHLKTELDLVLSVVDEAHLVLSDDVRRERYRRALETYPP